MNLLSIIDRTRSLIGLIALMIAIIFSGLGGWLDQHFIAEQFQFYWVAGAYTAVGLTLLIAAMFGSWPSRFLPYMACAAVAFLISLVLVMRPYSLLDLTGDWTVRVIAGLLAIGGVVVLSHPR